MKLIKCSIENYGTLSGFKYEFNDNLNIINEENGFGKSTLASFIKAMFYGLDNAGKSKVLVSERKKYMPWNRGKFGGSLDFEIDNKVYRIERFFEKTEKKDTFKLVNLKTGLESKDFSLNVGEELFGVDKDAFEKSTFFPQLGLDVNQISDSIHQKLVTLVESKGDTGYNDARKVLEEKSHYYFLNKSKGLTVTLNKEIEEIEIEIKKIESFIIDKKNKEVELKNLDIEKNSILNEEDEINKLKDEIVRNDKNTILYKQYKEIKDKINNLENKKISLENLGIPSEEELKDYNKAKSKVQINKNVVGEIVFNDERYEGLLNHKAHLLSENVILQIENVYNQKSELISILNQLKNKKYFDYNKELEAINDNEYKVIENFEIKKDNKNKIITIVSGVLFAVSLGLLIIDFLFLISSFVFLVVFLVSLFKMVFNKSNKEVLDILSKVNGSSTEEKLYKIKREYPLYLKVKSELFEDEKKVNEINEELNRCNSILNEKKVDYKYSELEDKEFINNIRKDYLLFKELETKKQNVENDIEEKKKIILNEEKYINSFASKYGFDVLFDNEIDERVKSYQFTCSKISESLDELNSFTSSHKDIDFSLKLKNSGELQEEVKTKEEALNSKKEILFKKQGKLNEEIRSLDALIDNLPIYESELLEKQELLKDAENEKDIINKAIELLDEAKSNISVNYLIPMKRAFDKYVKLIDTKDKEYRMDIDLNIQVEEFGEGYEIGYLSKGYQDLVNICLRLSLVESIFKKEKPILILDDPFVNLDENKLLKAKKMLEEISKEYQVLYLVCHESRA